MTTEHENRCTLPRDHHGACALPSAIEQHRRSAIQEPAPIWRVSRMTDLGGTELHTFASQAEAEAFAEAWDQEDEIEISPSSPEERNSQLEEQARAEADFNDAAKTLLLDHGFSQSDLDDLLDNVAKDLT